MSRAAAVRRVGLLVLAANVVFLVAKGGAWVATGSLAVGSEAANSLVDAGYATVVLGGLYLTTRPPDVEHPHGHERIEPFVSLVVALGIFAAGTLVLQGAVTSLLAGYRMSVIGGDFESSRDGPHPPQGALHLAPLTGSCRPGSKTPNAR
ncbi:hypothetical protein BRC80_01435 [Halobacteriales archaeon QH_9_66_26]|nr:MAG: hypothetical protein BRC80_01435 [Halobacteriales archaeon QH_9_66_26]